MRRTRVQLKVHTLACAGFRNRIGKGGMNMKRPTSGSFGQMTSQANFPRNIQVGLWLNF